MVLCARGGGGGGVEIGRNIRGAVYVRDARPWPSPVSRSFTGLHTVYRTPQPSGSLRTRSRVYSTVRLEWSRPIQFLIFFFRIKRSREKVVKKSISAMIKKK